MYNYGTDAVDYYHDGAVHYHDGVDYCTAVFYYNNRCSYEEVALYRYNIRQVIMSDMQMQTVVSPMKVFCTLYSHTPRTGSRHSVHFCAIIVIMCNTYTTDYAQFII